MKRIALCLAALSLCTPLWAELPSRCPGLGAASDDVLKSWRNLDVCDHAVWALIHYSNPHNRAAMSAYENSKDPAYRKKVLTEAAAALGKVDARMEAVLNSGEAVLSSAAALGVITKLEIQPLAVHVPAADDKNSLVLKQQKLSIAAFATGDPKPDKLDPAQGALMLGHLLSDGKNKAVVPGQLVVDFNKAVVGLNNQISKLIEYKVFKDLKNNLKLAETPPQTDSLAASMDQSQKLAEMLAGKAEPAGDLLKALQSISDMNMDQAGNIKDLPRKPVMSFLDPVMRNALRVQTLQVGKAFAQAQASLKKQGKTVKEAVGDLEKLAKDRGAEQARQAKIDANAKVMADKMAAALNQQRDAGTLPDAQGTITVTPQAGGKGETVFTAKDGLGTSVVLKTLPSAAIEKMTEAEQQKAAEEVGTKEAAAILNGNFRAARTAALKEALSPDMAPGADGKVPAPKLPSGAVLGPGGMMGGEPGCGAAAGESLADYKKRLAEDAKKKSAQNSATRQKLKADYTKQAKRIGADYDAEMREVARNEVMTGDEKEVKRKAALDKRNAAFAALDAPLPAADQAITQAETDNQVANFEASMRAERLLRSQTALRIETIRDSWEKDPGLAKAKTPGEIANSVEDIVVKAYFKEQWAPGSKFYDKNMTDCVGQVSFSVGDSVDAFVGRHLAAWCQKRKKDNPSTTTTTAPGETPEQRYERVRQGKK